VDATEMGKGEVGFSTTRLLHLAQLLGLHSECPC
jgi:hypothetical protein